MFPVMDILRPGVFEKWLFFKVRRFSSTHYKFLNRANVSKAYYFKQYGLFSERVYH